MSPRLRRLAGWATCAVLLLALALAGCGFDDLGLGHVTLGYLQVHNSATSVAHIVEIRVEQGGVPLTTWDVDLAPGQFTTQVLDPGVYRVLIAWSDLVVDEFAGVTIERGLTTYMVGQEP